MTESAISEKTRVTLSIVLITIGYIITIAGSVGGAVLYLDRRISTIENKMVDNYTMGQAAEDALREAIANPGHRVPDPRNPGQYIRVDEQQP